MRTKQLQFHDDLFKKPSDKFGGSLLNGNNPKCKRPLESKLPIHLVLRAKKGGMRLPKTLIRVNDIVESAAKSHGVKVYRYANVGNHIHMVIKLSNINRWAAFIREVTGRIALLMRTLGISRESFWLYRPFTRIVRGWKSAYRKVCEYVYLNRLEADGFINRKETRTLKDLHAIWADP